LRASAALPGLAAAFTLSGAAALVAEQVFEKLLSTLLGASTPAAALVLSIYFAGLTAGALLYPRLRRLRVSPLFLYPALELLVAAACLTLAWCFEALVPAFAPVLRIGVGKPVLLTVLRGVVASVWILPLTIPMGATFPAIVDAVDRVTGTSRPRSVSVLYAANLVGAILAAVGAPIALFPFFGMNGGLYYAASFDVIAALVALLFLSSPAKREESPPDSPPVSPARRVPRRLVAFAATTGFLFFALEVTWTHLASAVIGNSVYAFAAILSSVLIGLGIGGVASALLFRRSPRLPPWAPGGALVAGALTLALAHSLWPLVPHAVAQLGSRARSFSGEELARFAVAAAVVVPPASVLGLAYPLVFRTSDFPEDERGGAAGLLAAVNALGCILGSIAVGFFLLPGFGSEATERLLVALAAVAGVSAVLATGTAMRHLPVVVAGAAALASALLLPRWNRLALTSGEHVYFREGFVRPDSQLLSFHEDARGGITTVVGNTVAGIVLRTLLTNGKFQGDDRGEMAAQTSFALVPTQYLSHFDRALVIGLGTGRTAFVVGAMGFGAIDVAEIAPGIVLAAKDQFAHVNHHVLDRPNVSLFLEDGRNLLLLRDATYDLITVEITSIWFAGATNLYSREFYALAKGRLREGGVLQQWIQLHHIGLEELVSVVATAHDVFPYVSLFVLGGQGLIVASTAQEEVQPAFAERLRTARAPALLGVADDSAALTLLVSSRLLAPADVARLSGSPLARINTDANRFLEYATPRYGYRTDDMGSANVASLASVASKHPAATP